MTGSASVPEAQPGDPVGVDVFRCSLKFGKDCEIVPGVIGVGVGNLQKHSSVALDDEGAVGYRRGIHLDSLVRASHTGDV